MMRFLLCLLATSLVAADLSSIQVIETVKGKKYSGVKVTAQTDAGLKIMHDGGVAVIPFTELPAHVLTLIGVQAPPPAEPDVLLPNPLPTPKGEYKDAELTGVDPDGIRIKHAEGVAKVPFESLPQSLLDVLGPFNADAAAKFRLAEAERNREAYVATRQAIMAAQNAQSEILEEEKAKLEAQRQELLANPDQVSPVLAIRIAASSTGGKSRDTTFKTSYGSYARTDTSIRNMVCAVSSVSRSYQRAHLQCLFLTRDVAGGQGMNYEIVADDLVSIGPMVTKTVEATGEAQQSDDKYVALGLRFRDGVKYVGWVWRAIDGQGRICAVYSSQPSYDTYGWSAPVD